GTRERLDLLTGREAHVSLLEVLPAADPLTEALRLAERVHDVYFGHLHVEHQLDGGLDVRLRRIAADAEHEMVRAFGNACAFLGDVRPDQHVHQRLFSHASLSSSRRTAATVASTLSCRARLSGSSALTGSTSTYGRLRDASASFSSNASTSTSTFCPSSSSLSFSTSSFVLGASISKLLTTSRRS